MGNPWRVKSKKQKGRQGWRWRYTNPITRKPSHHTEWIYEKKDAQDAFDAFINGLECRRQGLPDTSGWTMSYEKLCEKFIAGFGFSTETQREKVKRKLERNELNIMVATELRDTPRLTEACIRLTTTEDKTRRRTQQYVRKYIQSYLKQMTSWAADAKVLPLDPLVSWRTLPCEERQKEKRAFTPEEMVGVIAAAAEYDKLLGHTSSTALPITAMLVAGNRPTALFEATVADLKKDRIELPRGKGKKLNGHAALPPDLVEHLKVYIKARRAEPGDPLFATGTGAKINRVDMGRYFDRCVVLWAVRKHWPAGATVEPSEAAFLIYNGRLREYKGPRPKNKQKQAARDLKVQAVERIVQQIGPDVRRSIHELYMYRLRHTHQTWADMKGVPARSIDKQIGHSGAGAGSRFYSALDLIDAMKSAVAVWETLKSAVAEIDQAKLPAALPIAVGAEHLSQVSHVESHSPDAPARASAGNVLKLPMKGAVTGGVDETCMAEREGFEPSRRLPACGLSKADQPNSQLLPEASRPAPAIGEKPAELARKRPDRSASVDNSVTHCVTQSPNSAVAAEPPPVYCRVHMAFHAPPECSPNSPDLQLLIDRWATLPEKRRKAILLMLED